MAINTQALFRQKQVQFGAGSSPTRFTADFLAAVSRAQSDMDSRAGISSTAINSVADELDLASKYEPYFSACLDFHLLMLGHNPGFDINTAAGYRTEALKDAQLRRFDDDTTLSTLLDTDS